MNLHVVPNVKTDSVVTAATIPQRKPATTLATWNANRAVAKRTMASDAPIVQARTGILRARASIDASHAVIRSVTSAAPTHFPIGRMARSKREGFLTVAIALVQTSSPRQSGANRQRFPVR